MNPRIIFKTFLICLILCSCGRNEYEKQLLGTWYTIDEQVKLEFYQDSLFISDIQNQRTLWNADKNKINHNYKLFLSDSIANVALEYKLSQQNDSLTITANNDSIRDILLIRSENFYDFLTKKNNIDFSLEKNDNADFLGLDNKFEIKIFIGYSNDSITTKSEYSSHIKNLEKDYEHHLSIFGTELKQEYHNSINSRLKLTYENWLNKFMYYSLFVDKNIPENIISKQINLLKESDIKKVYQIYYTNEIDRDNIANYIHFNNLKRIDK